MSTPVKAWFEFAKRDLIAAQELLENEFLSNIVIFHCQQCIEKSLKALLEHLNIIHPKVHGINKLITLIPENIRVKLSINQDQVNLIDDVYIDTRYPANFGLLPSGFPSKKQAKKLFEIAEKL